jgi:cytochrome c553
MTADLRARAVAFLKRLMAAALVLLLAGIFGGLFVMISGIVPIKASSGHWPITVALLQFSKRRSVATHALRVKAPLLDERMVMQGAAHYDFACEPCHGSPALQQPRIARQMAPRPPDLHNAALTYDPQHLFYIVKHGIKFTGMPAWPARHRDDEVWAMVAFLLKMPELDTREYDELTGAVSAAPGDLRPLEDLLGPSPRVPDAITKNCARCHGLDGLGRGAGAFPRLAGQRTAYLAATLAAYAKGERHSGVMEPVAAHLGTSEMQEIADYYSRLPAGSPPPIASGTAGDVERGRQIATQGVRERSIPACRECHGPGRAVNQNYPRLAGQFPEYLTLQLWLFKAKHRGGTKYHTLMHKFVGQLTDEHVRAVTRYYASLEPEK